MARKIKPFKGWLPVPVLPAAQVQATSYAQHLAYLEWYIDYLSEQVALCEVLANKVTSIDADSTDEQYPSAKAVQTKLVIIASTLQTLSEAVTDIPQIRVNRPLAGTEDPLTALEYNGTNYKVSGDGQQVLIPSQVSVGAGEISITHKTLPAGAVIDRIDVMLYLSGGTTPQMRTLIPTDEIILGSLMSTDQSGGLGYCVWNKTTNVSDDTTITKCEISTNTLWATPLTATDIGYAGSSRIYYHIEV